MNSNFASIASIASITSCIKLFLTCSSDRSRSLWKMGAFSPPSAQEASPPLSLQRLFPKPRVLDVRKTHAIGSRIFVFVSAIAVLMIVSTLRVHLITASSLMNSNSDRLIPDMPSLLVVNWTRQAKHRRKRPPTGEFDLEAYELRSTSLLDSKQDWTTAQGLHSNLCGSHAQESSQRHPGAYPSSFSLDQRSRVLISGLLSTVGMHLALRLVQECGVQRIMGLDAMIPNTRKNRIQKVEQYALLMRVIPNLERLVVPYVGILPKEREELIQSFGPTHIVHLHSGDESSMNPLYHLRNSMTSVDQLFALARNLTVTPNIVYIPSELRELDAVIASTYHALHRIPSTSLKLPNVYGPWELKSWPFGLGEQIVRNRSVPSDIMIPSDDAPFLFVDDAVDAVIVAMQFHQGVTHFDLTSHTTKSDIERAMMALEGSAVVSKSSNLRLPKEQVRDWLGWAPSTTAIGGSQATLAWHYNRAHPYDRPTLAALPAFQPLPYSQNFPCASECSLPSHCRETAFDTLSKISRKLTHGCKYAVYMVDLKSDVAKLPYSPESSALLANMTSCRVAFVSGASSLVQQLGTGAINGQVTSRGWSVVWLESEASKLSEAENILPKLSPGKLFSNSVSRAMFVDASHFPLPSMDNILGMIRLIDAPARRPRWKKIFRSGTDLFKSYESTGEPARSVIFFGFLQKFPFPQTNEANRAQYYDFFLEGVRRTPRIAKQLQFYDQAAHFVQNPDRRSFLESSTTIYRSFPFQFIDPMIFVHNLREDEGRLLRCEWYDEQIVWGNPYLIELSMAYVLARRRIDGRQGQATTDQGDWAPLLVPDSEERLQNEYGEELFMRLMTSESPFHKSRYDKRGSVAESARVNN